MGGVYMAMIANDTPSPLLPSDEMVSIEQQTTDAANKKPEATNNTVKIDPEGLPGRLIKLPLQAGNYDNFYSDGKKCGMPVVEVPKYMIWLNKKKKS